MNPWEVVAAKLDRFFFGHDHDTEIVDGAEQLAEAEETEETWLGNDECSCGHTDTQHVNTGITDPCTAPLCSCLDGDHRISSMDSRRTASVGDGPAPLDDPPVAGLAHSNELAIDDPLAAAIRRATERNVNAGIVCIVGGDVFHLHSWTLRVDEPMTTKWIEPLKDIERYIATPKFPKK